MNEQEKSLKLAELMGWEPWKHAGVYKMREIGGVYHLDPYSICSYKIDGLAQFAAILLHDKAETKYIISVMQAEDIEFTQEHFLDMKLIENGVDIDG